MNYLFAPIDAVLGILSDAKKSVSTMDSASKMLTNGWKMVETSAQIAHPAVTNLAKQFSNFSDLVGAFNILDRLYEWISPKKRQDWTWQNYISKASLTV